MVILTRFFIKSMCDFTFKLAEPNLIFVVVSIVNMRCEDKLEMMKYLVAFKRNSYKNIESPFLLNFGMKLKAVKITSKT